MTLTKNDLKQIGNMIDNRLDLRFENQKEEIEQIMTKFRSDMFTKIDPILKEVLTAREERPIMVHRQEDHEDRIEVLEKIHPQGKHSLATA